MQPNEFPHNLYIQNYSTANSTCISLRKWYFSPQKELELIQDTKAIGYLFYEVVEDVNRGFIETNQRLHELKALQEFMKAGKYLDLARQLPGYGQIVFPQCLCDFRHQGYIMTSISYSTFTVYSCDIHKALGDVLLTVSWDAIDQWEIDEEDMTFSVRYRKNEFQFHWLKLYTQYVSFSKFSVKNF